MKVCLISPPTVTEFNERQMGEREAYRVIAEYAPLGVLSLAAVLEREGLQPHVVDLNPIYYDYVRSGRGEQFAFSAHVVRQLEALPCDVFGFGTICSSYPLTLRLARELKRRRPEVVVVLGGPQASVVDVLTMKEFPFVDFILRGESEVTLPQLLGAVSSGGAGLEAVGGLTYRRGGEVARNPNAPVVAELDELPLPAYHLFPHVRDGQNFPLEAGRGCPFACTFCSTNDFFRRRFRLKSPRVLVGQMRLIKQTYGVDTFDLVHDMFTVDRRKVLAFCEEVEESGEKLRWSCSARTDCLDDELLDAMASAGCRGIFFGIDSGSERMQKILNKGLDIREAASRVARTQRHGIETTVSMIAGFPEETEEDMRASVRFLGESLRYKKTTAQFHLLAPLAETPITTQHRERLVYDEIFSDVSFQGWEQDPEDRAMITAHRDIFPNFYAVPTEYLDRRYLMEIREFLLRGVTRHRWLMAFLHQSSGDLSRVFEEWRACTRADGRAGEGPPARDYYRSRRFTDDLLAFVRSRYPEVWGGRHLATTLAEVEATVPSLHEGPIAARPKSARARYWAPPSLAADSVPVIAEGVKLVQVGADYKRLIRCLRSRGRLDRIPAERVSLVMARVGCDVKILQPGWATCRLLELCDGSRNLLEVAGSFASGEQVEGVSAEHAGLYGVLALNRQGLVDIKAAAA